MEPFNKQEHKLKMKSAVDNIIAYFKQKGIEFGNDDTMENVMFASSKKNVTISHHSFYRYSGIAMIYRDKGEHFIEAVPVTEAMYMDIFIKPAIEAIFRA